MIELVVAVVGIIALIYMKATTSTVPARRFLYDWLGVCFCLILIGAMIVYYQNYSGTVVSTTAPASNTIYRNTNYSEITIYATSTEAVSAWIGNSTTNLALAINTTPDTVSGIGVSFIGGQATVTLAVPQGDYYKYNYTNAAFTLVEVRT